MTSNSKKLFSCITLFFLFFSYQSTAKPSIKDYGSLPSSSKVSISPDGKLIVFRRVREGEDNLIVYSLKEKKMIRGVDVSEITPQSVYFINNEQVIFTGFQNKKLHGFKGRVNLGTAFIFDIKDGDIRQLLTPGRGIYTGQSGLGSIAGISPDGKFAYMPAYVDRNNYALMKTVLNKKRTPRVVKNGKGSTKNYFVNQSGILVGEERYNEASNMHTVWALNGDDWEKIYEKETDIPEISVIGVTPDSQSLIVLDEANDSGRVAYFSMSLKDGKISDSIFSRNDADIEGVLIDINNVVHGLRYSGFRPSYEFFDKTIQKNVESIISEFPRQSVKISSWTPDWKSIVVYVEGNNYSGHYFKWHAGKLSSLTSARNNIKTQDIHTVTQFEFKARDGMVIPTLITIPNSAGDNINNLPTIMLPHGGPASYDRIKFDWLSQAFANEGYIVIQPQFRGSSGFGLAHKQAGYGEWGKKMQDDLTDALSELVNGGYVDPNRVCIVGWSYGGYAALAGGAFTPDLYKCVVSINGVSDIPKMMKQERSDHGKNHWVVSYWNKVIANGDSNEDMLETISPARHAKKFKAPVLLLHGAQDKVVNVKQSKYMKEMLEDEDKVVEMKIFKGDNHSLTDNENRLEALTLAVDFVNKHLGNK